MSSQRLASASGCLHLLLLLCQGEALFLRRDSGHLPARLYDQSAFVKAPLPLSKGLAGTAVCRNMIWATKMSLDAGKGDKGPRKQTILQVSTDQSEVSYTDVKQSEESEEVMSMMAGLDTEEQPSAKVRVFGANLDSKFASRGRGLQDFEDLEVTESMMQKALVDSRGDLEKAKKTLRNSLRRLQKAEDLFRNGVSLMKSGQYDASIKHFMDAIATTPDGPLSREGGQYTIWLSQALAAKGERAKALLTIRTLRTHEDRDIQRVASGVEYIYSAPELEVGAEYFQWIEIEKLEEIKEGPKQRMYAKMEKMPEKYSLEWYMLQKPTKKQIANGQDAQLLVAGTVMILTALVAYGSYFPATASGG